MNYTEAIQYLETEVGFGSVPGLERIEALCEKLRHPEQKLSVIHVAGTNGKGSATAMLSSVLREAGLRVGVYTSPHLETYRERFSINGELISEADFAAEVSLMKQLCAELSTENKPLPTLFEILTGAAFDYFLKQDVDILILEVGLGGRFDATNIVPAPLLSLIMSISIDHTDFLGNSLEAITQEKAGIIKKNCPVVLYSQEEIVYNIVKNTAIEQNSPFFCSENKISVLSQTLEGTVFAVKNELCSFDRVKLSMLGSYQIQNCATVLQACAVLQQRGLALSEEQILNGIAKAHWAGRMELLGKNPFVLLDGAHNADGILQLARSLSVYFPSQKVTLILGVLGDKEYTKMAEEILDFAQTIILTEPQSERKLDVFTLSRSLSAFSGEVYLEKEIGQAFEKALSVTAQDGIILCCGSLYMIGAMRTYLHTHTEKTDSLKRN